MADARPPGHAQGSALLDPRAEALPAKLVVLILKLEAALAAARVAEEGKGDKDRP